MDKTRKLWLMYPPTHHNLELFSGVVGGNHFSLLGRIGLELEGGVIAVTGNEGTDMGNHLIMPEGTIHAVLTLQGGVLGGTNWGTAQGLPLAAEMLRLRIDRMQWPDQLDEDLMWFMSVFRNAVDAADANNYPLAFNALSNLLDKANEYPSPSNKLCETIRNFAKEQWRR